MLEALIIAHRWIEADICIIVFDYETKWKGECHAVAGVLNMSQPVDAVSTKYLRRSRTQPPEKIMKKLVIAEHGSRHPAMCTTFADLRGCGQAMCAFL